MSTPAAATAEKPEAKKNRDIYVGYAGKFDAASLNERNTKADKPMASAKLVVSDNKSVVVSAFTAEGIAALKEAVASKGEVIIQGYLADAPGYMNLHKVGASEYTGELANVRSGVSEGGVAYFDAMLKTEINGKSISLVAKAFGEVAEGLANAKDGDKLSIEGYAMRTPSGSGENAGYRSGIQVTSVTSIEPAAKKEAEAADEPSM
mgnify:CR=1 FL=1